MEKYKLKVSKRDQKTPNQIRREGNVPATMYGANQEPENLQFSAREFSRLPSSAFSHLLELEVSNGKPINVIIRHVQRKSTTGDLLNVEFYRVRMDKKITVTVPIKFSGTSKAVVEGAQLFEMEQEVEIECLPSDIPDIVEADLSMLTEVDAVILISDLKVSDKVKILNPHDAVVAKAAAPRAEEEEKAEEAGEGEAAAAAETQESAAS